MRILAAWARRGVVLGVSALGVLLVASSCFASVELSEARTCRKAFNVQGRTYALKRLGLVLGCSDKLLKCELVAEIDGVDPTNCRAAVTESCLRRIGPQADSALGRLAAKFDAKVGISCQQE